MNTPAPDTLIINFEYCGTCHGHCPTCALGVVERSAVKPFLSSEQIEGALRAAAARADGAGAVAIGLGRGDLLALGDKVPEGVLACARTASTLFAGRDVTLELATSLIGKPQRYRTRAVQWLTELADIKGVDARFNVVADLSITSPAFWRQVREFLAHTASWRGGGDGSGDILVLNLSGRHLPAMAVLAQRLAGLRSPVNLVWNAVAEDDLARVLPDVTAWLADFWSMARDLALDCNLVNSVAQSLAHSGEGAMLAAMQMETAGHPLLVVDQQGRQHRGLYSPMGDLDPLRSLPSAPAVIRLPGERRVASPLTDLRQMTRHRACRACPFQEACLRSGAYKIGLVNLVRHAGMVGCPACMDGVFRRATQEEKNNDTGF